MAENNIIGSAKETLKIEANAILNLINSIDDNFVKAVNLLYSCKGRVIVTGMGKSGLVGRKIASTLASTGTPAFFLHPAEGRHGDIGMVVKEDCLILISNSGETEELIRILPIMKRIGAKLITMTGDLNSSLAKNSDVIINISIKEEACPFGLAPTASTTATLAIGDALAIALLKKRNFKEEDYALFHPGGSIGRKLLVKVEDIMRTGNDIPVVNDRVYMKEAIIEMTTKKMGCTLIVDKKGVLAGIITDQDLRRILEKEHNIFKKKVMEIMTKNPQTIKKDELVARAIRITEEKSISTLIVVDDNKKPIGIVHLHDLLKVNV